MERTLGLPAHPFYFFEYLVCWYRPNLATPIGFHARFGHRSTCLVDVSPGRRCRDVTHSLADDFDYCAEPAHVAGSLITCFTKSLASA
jgi:hypothetical protein